ncbi:uncharacterized protein LOC127130762 [Lathyrus oleraceus]|uniref:uncharacterized protein LOC127130762 n=1 Tax=Pisum sativum TaxID=3888 RepID=UPI0021D16CE2|nr:uncharacterized protein LOC127130762 [Pisum sativum]
MDTVKPMFYERMVSSVSASFSDLVVVGIKVELGLKNGKMITTTETSGNNVKKFSRGFQKKKEDETNSVSTSQRRSHSWRKQQQQVAQQQPTYPMQYIQQPYVAAVTPTFKQSQALVYQLVQQALVYQRAPTTPVYQQLRPQAPRPQNHPNPNRVQRGRPPSVMIPIMYIELYPSLLQKGLVTPRPLDPSPDHLPPWYNKNAHCPFHEGALGHDLEGCYALKHIVRELVEKKILSFRDDGPNVKSNPLPTHGDVNAIEDVSDVCIIKNVEDVKTLLLSLHARLVRVNLIDTCHDNCEECVVYPRGCKLVRADIQNLMDQGVLQVCDPTTKEEISVIEPFFNLPEPVEITYQRRDVIHPSPVIVCMPTPFPFKITKVVPWKYDIIVVDGNPKDVECEKSLENVDSNITNIARTSRMTHSGRIYTPNFNIIPQESIKEATTSVPTQESGGVQSAVQSSEAIKFLKIIKKNDYKIVDQLHQTPPKIYIISLILNSQAHREALLKVLAQAHVTRDITFGQFNRVVTNITVCNTLSFSNEELPKEGQNHNCALHVSIKCQEDALARVLVDTESSLNVLAKRALAKLSYQGSEMKPNTLVVKAFDGSQRTIHAAGEVTSTLHQKIKFVVNNKLVIVLGEEDFIISPLSSFHYIEADEYAFETSFQALDIANATLVEVKGLVEKASLSFASLKSAKSAVESGGPASWGQVIDVSNKKDRFDLGYKPSAKEGSLVPTKDRIQSIQ